MQSKKNKPVGTAISQKISNGEQSTEEHKLEGSKEEIETFFASLFFDAACKENNFPFSLSNPPRINEQNDLDFSLEVDGKNTLLELMEIAPLENTRGGYSNASASYSFEERCEFIQNKITQKSTKYGGIDTDIFLLLYSTDWKFDLNPIHFRTLSKMFHREDFVYKAVFYISWFPATPEENGKVNILFPPNISPYFSQPEVVSDLIISGPPLQID